ncbi:MAG: twin-arginine translocase subunit TatC [Deltaproteobacteria bacterium]|nr:twin-arginine translocase subunit TatC [Deltaproteobacteria bacterium]
MTTETNAGLPLVAHLRELRRRLVISAVAVAVGFALCYFYSVELYDILKRPLVQALPPGEQYMVFSGIVEPFFLYMKVGFLGGLIAASPVILHQIWAFAAPGLKRSERRWFVALVASSFILFISGTLFAYFLVFPFGFKYLLSFSSAELRPLLSMSEYFSMVTKLLLAFGLVFQTPLAILVLARLGIVTGRQLLSWWRYALVGILIIAAVLTPTPDVFNQMLMAGPLIVLYALGIILAWVFGKKRDGGPTP